ncbi:MAG: T9SS type A sorting domain-containing protein [Bacteroidetes bacterium]|nr:T9SS type A sorting domain-containing protein [Bacteroidota bacterium]
MKFNKLNIVFFIFLIFTFSLQAQVIDGEWECKYATFDNQPNATGNRTISTAAYGENNFVALVADFADNDYYLVGYKDADSANGRLGTYQYSGTNQLTLWLNGFDQIFFNEATDVAAMKYDSKDLIFVANNDEMHNILVFEMTADSFQTYPMRMSTGSLPIYSIDIDELHHVYVTVEGDSLTPGKVLIYDSPENESEWSNSYSVNPLQIIELPDAGSVRGVTASSDGSVVYVSNFMTGKVYCYIGNPNDGYNLYTGFNFQIDEFVTEAEVDYVAGPWGLRMLHSKNILFVCAALDFVNSPYSYGKVYLVNPNDGSIIDTIDTAKWNFDVSGSYNSAALGTVSGYASPYNCDFDEFDNAYIVSYYGWTVDKWKYSTTLPNIEITITGVEKINSQIPKSFEVSQNYPNPFNPSTTIEFAITERAPITLSIYNVNGELIVNLVNGVEFEKGSYKVTFDASKLASGTYIYSLNNGLNTISKKMTLLK